MERKELMRKIDEAMDKAPACMLCASDDADEQCSLYLAPDDRLYLYDLQTPFTADDVAAVLYHCEAEDAIFDETYVRVVFENDDYWQFGDDGLTIRAGWRTYSDPEEAYGAVYRPTSRHIMGWQAVTDRLRRCLLKCGLEEVTVQAEAGEVQDLYFDRGRFFVGGEFMTPYTENDFAAITYVGGGRWDAPSYVHVRFRSGDVLRITPIGLEGEVTVAPGRRVCRQGRGYMELCRGVARAQRSGTTLTEEFAVVDGALVLYNGQAEEVCIPEGVDYLCAQVFREMPIRRVVMPGTLRDIGPECFRECSLLEKVELNEGLREIQTEAFVDCAALDHIDLPDSLTGIGCLAFGHTGMKAFGHVPDGCYVSSDAFELDLPFHA